MNLKNADLNLLVALDVLLAERNVTKAAARLSLGQPATSAAPTKPWRRSTARRIARAWEATR